MDWTGKLCPQSIDLSVADIVLVLPLCRGMLSALIIDIIHAGLGNIEMIICHRCKFELYLVICIYHAAAATTAVETVKNGEK